MGDESQSGSIFTRVCERCKWVAKTGYVKQAVSLLEVALVQLLLSVKLLTR
jgi:hypothetical protein